MIKPQTYSSHSYLHTPSILAPIATNSNASTANGPTLLIMVHHHAFRPLLTDAFLFHATLAVLVERRLIPERFPADWARKRTFPCVGAPMVHQLA